MSDEYTTNNSQNTGGNFVDSSIDDSKRQGNNGEKGSGNVAGVQGNTSGSEGGNFAPEGDSTSSGGYGSVQNPWSDYAQRGNLDRTAEDRTQKSNSFSYLNDKAASNHTPNSVSYNPSDDVNESRPDPERNAYNTTPDAGLIDQSLNGGGLRDDAEEEVRTGSTGIGPGGGKEKYSSSFDSKEEAEEMLKRAID